MLFSVLDSLVDFVAVSFSVRLLSSNLMSRLAFVPQPHSAVDDSSFTLLTINQDTIYFASNMRPLSLPEVLPH